MKRKTSNVKRLRLTHDVLRFTKSLRWALAAKLESPPEEMEQGAVYSWLILICALFRESLYRSWRGLSTGLCHCEEAGFADEAIPKLRCRLR